MKRIQDVFKVEKPTGGSRNSEGMITSAVTLIFSIFAAIIAKEYAVEIGEADIAILTGAVVGAITSITGLVLRWRSKGGVIKAKVNSN